MTNQIEKTKPTQLTAKNFFQQDNIKAKFNELLGKRSSAFITSVLQAVASNDLLAKAEPTSIYHCACVAASLDLAINPNLGHSYMIPFNQKQSDGSYKTMAQFIIGAKGFRQLAMRSGQFLTIHETDVREGEIKNYNRLTGEIEFNWIQNFEEREAKKIVGYVSYFKLINGFEQTFYMTIEDLKKHGKQYSQTYKKNFGLWVDNFDSMCRKSVLKLNLSKNAPLSIDVQRAIVADQAIIKDSENETLDVDYIDNIDNIETIETKAEDVSDKKEAIKEKQSKETQTNIQLL